MIEQGGTKHDKGKPRMGLLPPDVLVLVAKVFTFGAEKYEPWNWTKGFNWSRLYDATLRHLTSWAGGEDNDPESGHSHLAHALCCLMMLAAHVLRGIGRDDRHKFMANKFVPLAPAREHRPHVFERNSEVGNVAWCTRCACYDAITNVRCDGGEGHHPSEGGPCAGCATCDMKPSLDRACASQWCYRLAVPGGYLCQRCIDHGAPPSGDSRNPGALTGER